MGLMSMRFLAHRSFSSAAVDISAAALWKQSGSTVTLNLNRPDFLNSLTKDVCVDIRQRVLGWRGSDSDVNCFIMKGNGKAFCAGGDIKALWRALSDANAADIGTGKRGTVDGDFFREEYDMNYVLSKSLITQVSLWDGIVMGGGVGLSVFGTFRIATENTVFAMPECSIGIFPDVGSSSWIPKLQGMGLYLGLTGCRLGIEDLLRTGLATHYISSDRIASLESEIISQCAIVKEDGGDRRNARAVVCGILDQFHHTNSAFDNKKSLSKDEIQAIERSFTGKESVDEILFSLETDLQANAHLADWISKTIKQIKKLPPTSLKITFALMAHTRNLTLRQCLESEYRMMMRCMSGPNFKEGIRAALIDKDGAPLWTPNTLADVSEEDVQRYFESLTHELELEPYDKLYENIL